MRIVIDTNVVISGTFFGGYPRKVLEAVVTKEFEACATPEITAEYAEITDEMIVRKQGSLRKELLIPFIAELTLIDSSSVIAISRDPDDDKFIACAVDAKAMYIVSGDKDLLDIGSYEDVDIITAKAFCERYLRDD